MEPTDVFILDKVWYVGGVGSEEVILVLQDACRFLLVVVPACDGFCRFYDPFCEHNHVTIMLDNARKTVGFPSDYYLQFWKDKWVTSFSSMERTQDT